MKFWASLVAQMVKNLPTMQETHLRSLGQENPLEKGMATHSSIRAWRIPQTEEPGGLQSKGSQRVRHNWVTNTHKHSGMRYIYKSLKSLKVKFISFYPATGLKEIYPNKPK